MLDRLFAWCGLHRPGKESGPSGSSARGDDDDDAKNRSETDNASDVGSEASSMISVEEIDPKTGRPHRVLKKKRSLIGRAYRKMTKTRSNNKNNKNEENATTTTTTLAPAGDAGA